MKDIRELFIKFYGSFDNAIGIYSSYKSTINTIEGDFTGEELIEILGRKFAKNNTIAITGKGIFLKNKSDIIRCKLLTNKIEKLMKTSEENLYDFSRCLAAIPKNTIFLLTPERSSSQKEEEEFLNNRFDENKKSFGILCHPEKVSKCPELNNKQTHQVCLNKDFNLCRTYTCPFIVDGKINAGDMEKHVKTDFSILLIVKSYKSIFEIVSKQLKYLKT